MTIKLYLLPNRIGLKFDQSAERDSFWSAMSDAGRAVSERIGNRTIRFLPQQMKDNQGLIIPLYGNGTVPVAVPSAKSQAAGGANPPVPPGIVNVASVSDPFAITGQNAHKALPGMIPVQSNMPPGIAQERLEPVQTPSAPQNAPQSQPSAEAVAPEPPLVAPDPEPVDRRTKKWREWKLRQIEKAK